MLIKKGKEKGFTTLIPHFLGIVNGSYPVFLPINSPIMSAAGIKPIIM